MDEGAGARKIVRRAWKVSGRPRNADNVCVYFWRGGYGVWLWLNQVRRRRAVIIGQAIAGVVLRGSVEVLMRSNRRFFLKNIRMCVCTRHGTAG